MVGRVLQKGQTFFPAVSGNCDPCLSDSYIYIDKGANGFTFYVFNVF